MAKLTLEQKKLKFVALVAVSLPELSPEEMDFYGKNPKVLRKFLGEALITQPKISKAIAYMAGQEEGDIQSFVSNNHHGGETTVQE